MPSNPVTPQPKSGGKEPHDPFADEYDQEQNGTGKEKGKGDKKKVTDHEEDQNGTEGIPTLFYAYARRSDNHWASRYLLTFASADTCKEWWSLVQTEYPDQGVRHGPQLFTFSGDDFLKKPATSKKFDHLKTQWFYSQFGDATGTGGRAQEIIPLQDYNGRIIQSSSGQAEVKKKALDKGKGKATATDDDDDDDFVNRSTQDQHNHSPPFDFSALADALQTAAAVAETTNAQVAQLVETQTHDRSLLQQQQEQSQRDTERMQRIEALVEENAQQLQSLAKSHIKAQQQNRELAEQNARVLRELKRQRVQAERLLEQLAAGKGDGEGGGEGGRQKEQGEIEGLHVVVHPPPRKIDRQLVGYAYHLSGTNAAGDGAGAKEGKGSVAKRPGVGNRMASSVGPKG